MRNVWIIAKRELKGYFSSPLAYIFVVIFVALTGAFAFYIGNFLERGQADLIAFFQYHTWLYLLLVPAIAMRLWAEERKTGTIELLMTLPVTAWEAILGKFLAAWAFIGVALIATIPMWFTVNYLGKPDNGVILASYIGSFLMAGAFLAIGSCISALTKNQVIAFIVSSMLCFLLVMSGAELVLNSVRALSLGGVILIAGLLSCLAGIVLAILRRSSVLGVASLVGIPLTLLLGFAFAGTGTDFLVQAVQSLSFLNHFEQMTKGVLSLPTLLFYLSIIAFFLFANVIVVEQKKVA